MRCIDARRREYGGKETEVYHVAAVSVIRQRRCRLLRFVGALHRHIIILSSPSLIGMRVVRFKKMNVPVAGLLGVAGRVDETLNGAAVGFRRSRGIGQRFRDMRAHASQWGASEPHSLEGGRTGWEGGA